MATFAELLTEYINQSGISDSELARSVGVRRQTIFRWKEGIVERTRHRDDVLRCAQRLHLAPDERDALLLAAGFAPERSALPADERDVDLRHHPAVPATESETTVVVRLEAEKPDADPASSFNVRLWATGAAVCLLVLVAIWMSVDAVNGPNVAVTPTPVATDALPTAVAATPLPIVAAAGETLVLVSQFANYSTDEGYNVAGRLYEVLQEEVDAAGLLSTTARIWPERLIHSDAAQQALADSRAMLVVWGEYDSGRVRAVLSTTEASADWEKLLPSAAELSATINVETPREVRSLAILTLGKLYRSQGDMVNARNAFRRVLELQPAADDTVATTKFYLASVLAAGPNPDYRAAITLYDDVIALRPEWVNAHYNRGSAYLDHFYTLDGSQADLDAAIADLTWAVQRRSGYANAYLNRGIAYYERGLAGDLGQAITDLDRAVALAPEDRLVRFNRGLARIRRGDDDWMDDFEAMVVENAAAANAHNALCWGYALDEEAVLALPHCDQALALGLTRSVYDGRGIALAQLGRTDEAIADLRSYLAELATAPETAYTRYRGPLVEAWIEALANGEDPFDTTTLESLR